VFVGFNSDNTLIASFLPSFIQGCLFLDRHQVEFSLNTKRKNLGIMQITRISWQLLIISRLSPRLSNCKWTNVIKAKMLVRLLLFYSYLSQGNLSFFLGFTLLWNICIINVIAAHRSLFVGNNPSLDNCVFGVPPPFVSSVLRSMLILIHFTSVSTRYQLCYLNRLYRRSVTDLNLSTPTLIYSAQSFLDGHPSNY